MAARGAAQGQLCCEEPGIRHTLFGHLSVEPQCWGPNRSTCKVDVDVAKEMQAARRAAASHFEGLTDVNARLVLEVLRKKETSLLALDDCFNVELLALQAMVETEGKLKLEKAVHDLMPTLEEPVSAESVLGKVKRIQTTPLYRVLPEGCKASVDMAAEILSDVAASMCPKGIKEILDDGTAFMQIFCGTFPYCYRAMDKQKIAETCALLCSSVLWRCGLVFLF